MAKLWKYHSSLKIIKTVDILLETGNHHQSLVTLPPCALLFQNLMDYKTKIDAARRETLDKLAIEAQELAIWKSNICYKPVPI